MEVRRLLVFNVRISVTHSSLFIVNNFAPDAAEVESKIRDTANPLIAWLVLCAGLSRSAAVLTLSVLRTIIALIVSTYQDPAESDLMRLILRDPRSVYTALSIEPQITRSVCCPRCFSPYTAPDVPDCCTRRRKTKSSTQTSICGEELWRNVSGFNDRVPARLYSTQCLKSWIQWLFMQHGMEETSTRPLHQSEPGAMMFDIYDSRAWREWSSTYARTPGNLTFGLFVDWFNPFTNKLAGKKADLQLPELDGFGCSELVSELVTILLPKCNRIHRISWARRMRAGGTVRRRVCSMLIPGIVGIIQNGFQVIGVHRCSAIPADAYTPGGSPCDYSTPQQHYNLCLADSR